MALSQTDLDDLDAAIATGALRVRFADGRDIQYRTLDEMLRARSYVASALTGTNPATPPSRISLVTL